MVLGRLILPQSEKCGTERVKLMLSFIKGTRITADCWATSVDLSTLNLSLNSCWDVRCIRWTESTESQRRSPACECVILIRITLPLSTMNTQFVEELMW